MTARRKNHWYILIYKCILGSLPSYHRLQVYICGKMTHSYSLRSQDLFLLSVPEVRTERGKKAFKCAAPSAWNSLQNDLRLQELVSLNTFKTLLNDQETETSGCRCFLLLLMLSNQYWLFCYFICFTLVLCLYWCCVVLSVCKLVNYAAACLGQDTLEFYLVK